MPETDGGGDARTTQPSSARDTTLHSHHRLNPMSNNLYAFQHIRRMRGGSQAHLLRASDGSYYVTKFQN
jgi:hypothetical protein